MCAAGTGDLFTLGIWKVKPGKESEFVAGWTDFARWSMKNAPGAAGDVRLLRDADKPATFISFGAWDSADRVIAWRQRPEFREFFLKARELCEAIEPHTLETVSFIPQH
jgi:heme-degrading monooxygenase HmoA